MQAPPSGETKSATPRHPAAEPLRFLTGESANDAQICSPVQLSLPPPAPLVAKMVALGEVAVVAGTSLRMSAAPLRHRPGTPEKTYHTGGRGAATWRQRYRNPRDNFHNQTGPKSNRSLIKKREKEKRAGPGPQRKFIPSENALGPIRKSYSGKEAIAKNQTHPKAKRNPHPTVTPPRRGESEGWCEGHRTLG